MKRHTLKAIGVAAAVDLALVPAPEVVDPLRRRGRA